ncbi:MAG: hypothetical protein JRH11_21510 [Deltaproteobacteria bacterium]|nr:hypothetical protein [Deltaproteobacteria bacterium]
MSEVLEIRTGREVSEVVDRLAREMGGDKLCLPVGSTVAEGEWVRFNVMLEDGTPVIEGVGRSEGAIPRGGTSKKFDLYLTELSFDTRNEIMYERMLIAKEAGQRGDHTGAIKLADVAMEEEALADDLMSGSDGASPRSVPPPPPAATLGKAPRLPEIPSGPPATKLPSKTPPAKKKAAASKKKKKKAATAPAKRESEAPPSRKSAAPPAGKSAAAGPSEHREGDTTRVDLEAPQDSKKRHRPSRLPPAIADGLYDLEVPHELVAQARRLEERLPRKLTNRDRTPKHPEAAVLKTALRIGLAALDAIAEDD